MSQKLKVRVFKSFGNREFDNAVEKVLQEDQKLLARLAKV
jgi:hypothetical protein